MINSKITEELNSMIIIQQNLIRILLSCFEKIVNSTNVFKILEDLKGSLEYCNKNISLLQNIIKNIEESNEDFEENYLNTKILINQNTIFVEDFLFSLLSFCEFNFPNSQLESKSNTLIGEDIKLKENTLVVSELTNKVVLPYHIDELENLKLSFPDKTYEEIIEENYTLPLEQFKPTFIARFREAFKLAHEKENLSIKQAFDLGTELVFNYNLHPAIISGCKTLDELDIYLDYLENNESEKFDCFKIVFEIPPILAKNKGN